MKGAKGRQWTGTIDVTGLELVEPSTRGLDAPM